MLVRTLSTCNLSIRILSILQSRHMVSESESLRSVSQNAQGFSSTGYIPSIFQTSSRSLRPTIRIAELDTLESRKDLSQGLRLPHGIHRDGECWMHTDTARDRRFIMKSLSMYRRGCPFKAQKCKCEDRCHKIQRQLIPLEKILTSTAMVWVPLQSTSCRELSAVSLQRTLCLNRFGTQRYFGTYRAPDSLGGECFLL